MKKLLMLLLCLPLAAIAQQSEFSFGLGSSACLTGNLPSSQSKGQLLVVPNVQATYLVSIDKHNQVGVSVGATSYRRKSHLWRTNDNNLPYEKVDASYRYAEIAIPLRAEGRHNVLFNKSRFQFGLNAGVVVCTGSKATSGPFTGKHPWAIETPPDPIPVGFRNTVAMTAGAMVGFDHAVNKKLRIGISPAVNLISGRFNLNGSNSSARSELIDLQLRVNCSYICTKKQAAKK